MNKRCSQRITSIRAPKLPGFKGERGFTLVEVLISLVIFGVVMAALPLSFLSYLNNNTRAEEKSAAIQVAQKILDGYRTQDPADIPTSGTSSAQTIAVDGKSYSAQAKFCLTPSFCNTNNRHITVEVSLKGELLYAVETVFTRLR